MNKLGMLVVAIGFLFAGNVKAQSFDVGMLDNALSMLDKGDTQGSSKVLGTAMNLLTKGTQASSGDFASKILNQAGSLTKMLPALSKGTANIAGVQKIVQTVKMLFGAMQLNNMLKGGNLMNNAAGLMSNVDLLKGGMSLLEGGKSVNKITKSLDKITKKAPKLAKSGWAGKMAQKAISKKLEGSLGLLKTLV